MLLESCQVCLSLFEHACLSLFNHVKACPSDFLYTISNTVLFPLLSMSVQMHV